jgi:hypothetical protein
MDNTQYRETGNIGHTLDKFSICILYMLEHNLDFYIIPPNYIIYDDILMNFCWKFNSI